MRGVNIIPASGEFVYATSIVRERRFPGIETPLNMNNVIGDADFSVSLDQMGQDLPGVTDAALTVAWFGTDLRAGSCRTAPGIEIRDRATVPYAWTVGGVDRGSAHLLSQTNGRPNFGGTPADQAVIEGIQALKAAGLTVTLSPFPMLDIPGGNGLPDPYGAAEQAAFPWRGRLTVVQDQTASARDEIASFVGEDGGFGFRHFILHHARLAVRAGGVEAILIGSEMVGLTRVRDAEGRFPFVEALIEIAHEVRTIVGPEVAISYAADWTEYGAYVPGDGSGDVLFPIDPLWACEPIDFVGLDWYPPLSDWRDGGDHLDIAAGYERIEDAAYLQQNLAGGEAFDWFYATDDDRIAQVRTPIEDGAHGEPWVFRQKDIANWWGLAHHQRMAGVRVTSPTAWVPQSKPIRLIELGVPAVDKGTNAPNVFFDPKSSESALPRHSNGGRDDLLQRRALAVANEFWRTQPMIEQVLNWAWDGRPWPDFPSRDEVWSDGPNWQYGHWLNGRSGLIDLSELVGDLAAQADISLDARALNGAVDGYLLDTVTSLNRALSPLTGAYEFSIKETDAGLQAEHEGAVAVVELSPEHTIEATYAATRNLLDKQPSGVTLQYISGDGSYQPAVIEARTLHPGSDLKIGLTYPIVLGAGRARVLAERRLAQILETDGRGLALPPGEALGLEVLDRVALDGRHWIVQRLEEHGLQRHLNLRPALTASSPVRSVTPPSAGAAAVLAAEPIFRIVDGPVLDHLDGAALSVAATGNAWIGSSTLKLGMAADGLSDVATLRRAAGLGRLAADFGAGPLGRWDAANVIELYMPGETLSSADENLVLSGRNRILIENDSGWELLAWRDADLVDTDTWHLTGLMRGLAGSPVRPVLVGALVILADDRLVSLSLGRDDIGRTFIARLDDGETSEFTFNGNASLPWRVGHLRTVRSGGTQQVSWTPRGSDFSNSWELTEASANLQYRVETYLGDTLVAQLDQSDTEITVPVETADLIRVATRSDDGRVGEWGSIPLPQP